MQPETGYARRRDGAVAYQVVGDGPLDLVLLISLMSHIEVMWECPPLVRFLSGLAPKASTSMASGGRHRRALLSQKQAPPHAQLRVHGRRPQTQGFRIQVFPK